ncbi:monosaccharide ABC transporter substrate-binding protein (CUT2 family) [Nocardia tenerifensis]|uniref:Monosaccharide ABC transporter substrate-binding protein (CUT2 family) n=1 Tax=Nocardia tenerifensis TaxID=228006 RepID=A0A318KMD4_9NOCA|nr:substrate-binding domain-containing protein [Nocardia tenerifensis]PXX70820.1 monosaccharide ABC transporter substrate-binding protein (CUT2 family) [Nocardia tenerifensis]
MSSTRRSVLIALALCTTAVAAVACASNPPSPSDGGQFVVGYSQSNNAEPYRAQLNLQLQYYVKQHPDLKLLPITDAHQDSATQVSQVQTFIQQKVNALIVSPNEPAPLTAAVQQACDAKIPVIILDRTVSTDCYSAFIGGDNYVIGKLAGEAAIKALPNGGNVVELRGILSDQPQIDRDKGFRDAIAGHNITIIEEQEAKWLKANATTIMQQWLSKGDKIDLVYAHNDDMALGAQLGIQGSGKAGTIPIIGVDGLAIPTGGIRAVQNGQLLTTFVYPTGAEQAVDTLVKLVHNQPVEKKQVLSTTQVTTENAAQIYQEYDMSGKVGG